MMADSPEPQLDYGPSVFDPPEPKNEQFVEQVKMEVAEANKRAMEILRETKQPPQPKREAELKPKTTYARSKEKAYSRWTPEEIAERWKNILLMLADGIPVTEVSFELKLSHNQINTDLKNMRIELGIPGCNTTGLVATALRDGIIT